MLLEGKVAVVTGGGRGIGREECIALAREGAKVVVNDLGCEINGRGKDTSAADETVDKIKEMGFDAHPDYSDISSPLGAKDLITTAMKIYGRIDILVNNAGNLIDSPLIDLRNDDLDAILNTHLKGTIYCTREVLMYMKQQEEGGSIINTTAAAGIMGNIGQTSFSAAKAGIFGLTKTWALELARHKIRVNAVAPVSISRITKNLPMFQGYTEEDMGPHHIAPVVVFLASDLSKNINGSIIGVHGRHIFSYYIRVSEGLKKESSVWSAQEISEKIKDILGH